MSEKFCLKWNDFQSNISKTFSSLRTEEEFYDVTLVSEDQHQVSAHKVVLAACSQYFKNVLKQNRHSNPLLCLDGVTTSELQFVLDYIYHGEVQIFQENLDRFLAVAEKFQLEGLINLPDSPKQEESFCQDSEEFMTSSPTPSATPTPGRGGSGEGRRSHGSVSRAAKPKLENSALVHVDLEEAADIESIEARISENLQKDEDGTFSCRLCGKAGVKLSRNMKNHIETHLEGLSFPCDHCGKTFRLRNTLDCHKSRHHRV